MMPQELDLNCGIKFFELKLQCNHCLFVYVCLSIAGLSAEVENGWPYMKAVFKKHCPWGRIRSDHK